MRKLFYAFSALILMAVNYSCSKGIGKKDTSVTVDLTNDLTGEAASIGMVRIHASKGDVWDYPDTKENISGTYNYSFRARSNWKYKVEIKPASELSGHC